MSWDIGTTIVLQEIWDGRVWSARPVFVVEDAAERLVLWCPRGTRWKAPTTPPERPREPTRGERLAALMTHGDWVFRDAMWAVSNLILVRPGDWHAVWVGWDQEGAPWGWYINFQRPFVRTARNVQTMDLMLDIVVDQDRQWRWKDEDEFAALIAAGHITAPEEAAVRSEADVVLARLAANEPPFSEPWHRWQPDPAWRRPWLPKGWEHNPWPER